MQKVLITGANGFVGHYLSALLVAQNFTVLATGTGACRLAIKAPNFSYAPLDITDAAAVKVFLQNEDPQVVVHAAAMTKPDECELAPQKAVDVNVGGTENLLQAAQGTGAYFLYISTDFVFAGTKKIYTETDEADPVNYYGYTKWEAEKKVEAYNGKWAVARPVLIYGAPQAGRQNILTVVANALKERKSLKLFTDQQRMPTYVEDLTWALWRLIEQKSSGIFHFCGKDVLSPYEMGLAVAAYFSMDASLIEPVTATEFKQPAKRPPQTFFDLSKAASVLGYSPTSFAEGLRKTFK